MNKLDDPNLHKHMLGFFTSACSVRAANWAMKVLWKLTVILFRGLARAVVRTRKRR